MATQPLQGRAALVTGAGDPVPLAVAQALGRAGAAVMTCDINPDRADRAAAAVRETGARALAWTADVSNRFQVGTLIERLRDEFGGLHVVVSGWQVNKRGPLLKLDEYDWRRVLEINLTGAFFLSQLAARVMADEGGGVIVQLVDGAGEALVGQTPYAVSQAGLRALTGVLAAELHAQGVRAEAVPLHAEVAPTVAAVMQAILGA
ncbi:MAG: SDR family NAD(P)-dependent oxidoreductase [Anaerolineae bacterium]|nr:SDR family NAD(P)-dependent oxidoreductase [Anaerolineae bacterium]